MRVALLSRRIDQLKLLVSLLKADARTSHLRLPSDTDIANPGGISVTDIDLLVVDELSRDWLSVATLEQICRREPHLIVMLVAREEDPELLVNAVSAGVREILRWPATEVEIEHALRQCVEKIESLGAHKSGQVFGIISAKGGSGATFVATNIAHVCAAKFAQRTLLIDLDLQYGDATFELSAGRSGTNILTVAQDDALDEAFLESACLPIRENLSLLAAPLTIENSSQLSPARLDMLIGLATRIFDVIVVDLTTRVDAVTLGVLERCNRVLQVVDPTVSDLRNQQRQLQYFNSSGIPLAKISVILNKMPASTRSAREENLFADEVRQHVADRLLMEIPANAGLTALAAGVGESIVAVGPDSEISRALIELGAKLLSIAPREEKKASRLTQWLFER